MQQRIRAPLPDQRSVGLLSCLLFAAALRERGREREGCCLDLSIHFASRTRKPSSKDSSWQGQLDWSRFVKCKVKQINVNRLFFSLKSTFNYCPFSSVYAQPDWLDRQNRAQRSHRETTVLLWLVWCGEQRLILILIHSLSFAYDVNRVFQKCRKGELKTPQK